MRCPYDRENLAVNPLFNQFLAAQGGANQDAVRQIGELSKKFVFGRSVMLRNPAIGNTAEYRYDPEPVAIQETEAVSVYSFNQLPVRQNIPYVTANMEVTVDDTGLCTTAAAPPMNLTAATSFWPADDPSMKALAKHITAGKNSNDDKVMAILEWLAPGKNLQYSGQTGSRWGVKQVFDQKFGHCWDFSDCFITLARAAGIPTRQVGGWLYGNSGHIWAEYTVRAPAGSRSIRPAAECWNVAFIIFHTSPQKMATCLSCIYRCPGLRSSRRIERIQQSGKIDSISPISECNGRLA